MRGKVAVVTGAGSGIGLAITRALAGAGCQVVAADLDPRECADIATPVKVDLATAEGAAAVITVAAESFGGIDILVNNAAVAPYRDSFTQIDDAAWQRTLEINVLSCVRLCRAAIPIMAARGGGSIVNIGSEAARHPKPYLVDYAVSKAALLSLAKALSMEFGAQNIRVNTVSPGPTRTATMDTFLASLSERLGIGVGAAAEHFVHEMRRLPLGRMNEPDDVANVVLFLASEQARQVTGSEYAVNAGSTGSI
jgi:NAD(P)-dependent dehydrogenase (short-subunit alcohol dehydrogenase family)